MTREEAIEWFRSSAFYHKDHEPINMAIKALEQEPKFIAKSDGTIEQIKDCDDCVFKKEWEKIGKLISVILEKQTKQDPMLEKIKAVVIKWKTDTWTDNLSCECMQKIADIVGGIDER